MFGKLFKKIFKNMRMSEMKEAPQLTKTTEVSEPCTAVADTILFSLGGNYKDREIGDIYRKGTIGEEGKGLPIVAIKNISIAAGGYDIVDTGMEFCLEDLNISVSPSFDLFTSLCDIYPKPVVPIHDATKRVKTGVNVCVRNPSGRPANIKAGTVIGYFDVRLETLGVILNTAM